MFCPLIQSTQTSQNVSITDPITGAETTISASGKWVTWNAQSGSVMDGTGTAALGIGLTNFTTDAVGIISPGTPFPAYCTGSGYACTTISAPNLVVIIAAGSPTIGSTTLTALSFPELKVAIGYSPVFSAPSALATISMPKLEYWNGSLSLTSTSQPLTTLNLPLLKAITGGLTMASSAAITSIDLTSLQYIGTQYTQTTTTAGLTTIPLPALVSIGTLSVTSSTVTGAIALANLKYIHGTSTNQITTGSITSLSLPALAYCHNLTLSTLTSLTTISLPALVAHGSLTFSSGNGNITTVTLGTVGTLKRVIAASTINLSGQKLNAAQVDGIFTLYASLDGTNGTTSMGSGYTINVSGGTNAAPTFTGTTTTPPGNSFNGIGTTVTATIPSHGFSTGDYLTISGITTLTNGNGTFIITVTGVNTFTYTISSYTALGGGTATVKKAGNTTEGYYKRQVCVARGMTCTTN